MAKKKKTSQTYTDPELDEEYSAIEEDEKQAWELEKASRKLELRKTDDDLDNKMLKTKKYQDHLDAAIFEEVLNADQNLLLDLKDMMETNGMQFVGQTKNETAREMTEWLINNYKYDPEPENEMDIRNEIEFTISETNPRLLLALQKRAIVGKAYSVLENYPEKSATERIQVFNHFIDEKKETLSKRRDTAFQEFIRDIGMKIASSIGLKDFAKQRLFKVHGKKFVNEVSPENQNPKPRKK